MCTSQFYYYDSVCGHSGDIGNEKADELVKLAANSELNVSYSLCPVSCIKRILEKCNLEKWNEKWIKSNNGKVTRDLFFPTVFNRLECKSLVPDYILTQFLTGHGKFGEYLFRFKISDTMWFTRPNCRTSFI